MSAAPPAPEAPAAEAALAARQAAALGATVEIGLQLARALCDQVASGAPGPFRQTDPALAYSRIARAIRLTVALEARLEAERAQGMTYAAPARAPEPVERAEDETAEAVEIEAEPEERPERPERETLRESLREDLEDAALLRRPNAEVYAQVCRDLGLTPEPDLFPDGSDNDNRPDEPTASARRLAVPAARAALLRSACAVPFAAHGPAVPPPGRPPP
jgi:hypothetical protein